MGADSGMSTEEYLMMAKNRPFESTDESVMLIQPENSLKEKVGNVDLECDKKSFKNNSISAEFTEAVEEREERKDEGGEKRAVSLEEAMSKVFELARKTTV